MDLSQLSTVELMQLNQLTLDELERRDIIRTRNNPISEYTEWLVAEKMKMVLAAPSTKGYDATTTEGQKIQIKSRKNNIKNKSLILGIIRNYDLNQFDELIAVIYNPDFTIRYAISIPRELVNEYGFYNKHQNGHTLRISNLLLNDPRVTNIIDFLVPNTERSNDEITVKSDSNTIRDVQTIGMQTFIEYYQYVESGMDTTDLIEKMVTEHPEWKESTARTKASSMRRVFMNGDNVEALKIIYKSNHPAITDEIKSKLVML
ncbi:hypothetical protein LVQ78_11150 [Buttiauxella sp. A2-C2_NF]|uniref:DUF6998 domain-containing protein n=1 Tax=Buttiauxella ferragutiae TaxID=82989 RepID=UPI001E4BEDF2|nr:hypothetical protein [Buttiauxella ferragutiae]MCE0826586.1 hypothetical protein [Buttiauxella ferragutiae]